MPDYVIRVVTKGPVHTKDRIVAMDNYGNNHVAHSLQEAKDRRDYMLGLFPKTDYQIFRLVPVKEKE